MKREGTILVIGGGISGMTAAVELAETGKDVILVEKEPYLGGNTISFSSYFPKLCPPACGFEINVRRIRSNRKIKVYTSSEVNDIVGSKGNYTVHISRGPALINDYCTSCGKCSEVCPEERPDAFNRGMGQTRAAYLPHAMAYPMQYVIDEAVCKGESCGKCREVCEYEAIDLKAVTTSLVLSVNRIIVATGWKPYDAARIKQYDYAIQRDVVTNVEFERILAPDGPTGGKLARISDGELPAAIAFIQCAGSRDINHLPYCSAVCCSTSLKHALMVTDQYSQVHCEIFYIDMRITGRNEDLLTRARDNDRIDLTNGKVGRITGDAGGKTLLVEVEDIIQGTRRIASFDMVVLATGMVPNSLNTPLPSGEEGFLLMNGVEGIYPTATAKKPMDVSASVKDATSAAILALNSEE